jgi:hypothetical protein
MKPFAILLEVNAAGQCNAEIRTESNGLTHFALLPTVLAFAQRLAATPGTAVSTMAETAAVMEREKLLKEHPAKRIFTRDGAQLWLGEAAVQAVGARLIEVGWMDIGDVPTEIVKACDRTSDPAAFDTKWLA